MSGNNEPEKRIASSAEISADGLLLIDVLQTVLGRSGGRRWTVRPTQTWCYVTPPVHTMRKHGWKLHVSATPLSAPIVLARAAEVMVRHGSSFKFGTDLRRVAELVGVWYDRGSAGKFITVYPVDDDQFRLLARELDQVTTGLAGPRILSDKPIHRTSLVHYRYGEFRADRVLTDDGHYESRLYSPDGAAFRDERKAWFTPPVWATSPFPDEAVTTPSAPRAMLLKERFRVSKAIRHANKGGVFRAVDERDGREVIVKQARAHIGARLDGTDVRDLLRAEARALEVLLPLSVAPKPVDFFEEQSDAFLVEEMIPGKPLGRWAAERVREGGMDVPEAVAICRKLVALVAQVHKAGLVIRDLKPDNLMMTPFGELRLIDVEAVSVQGQEVTPYFTRGFAAPEIKMTKAPCVIAPSSDHFSLGATVFVLLTALPPSWVSDQAQMRAGCDREQVLQLICATHPILEHFIPMIVGLTEPDNASRWSLAEVDDCLARILGATGPATATAPVARIAPANGLDRLIADGVIHLQRTMDPRQPALWPHDPAVPEPDPCNAWFGAAGVLAVLTQATDVCDNDSLARTVAEGAAWIEEKLVAERRLLPGLLVGRAGTAWALFDAGTLLGDERLAGRALGLARSLPTDGKIADVMQGLSGAGMAHVHLWHATKEPDLLQRINVYADAVIAAADHSADRYMWPMPLDVDSVRAGLSSYGYASGIAGVGSFLLAAAGALESDAGDPRSSASLRKVALGIGDTLIEAAIVDGGSATWPATVDGRPPSTDMWCKGAAGIGAFLVRLWAATGDQRFADLADQAVAATVSDPWSLTPGACCGLAGGGHFLLDMAELTGDTSYRARAEDFADIVYAHHVVHQDLRLAANPDHGANYQRGVAGVLSFLMRLIHGGHHPWWPASEIGPEHLAGPREHAARRGRWNNASIDERTEK